MFNRILQASGRPRTCGLSVTECKQGLIVTNSFLHQMTLYLRNIQFQIRILPCFVFKLYDPCCCTLCAVFKARRVLSLSRFRKPSQPKRTLPRTQLFEIPRLIECQLEYKISFVVFKMRWTPFAGRGWSRGFWLYRVCPPRSSPSRQPYCNSPTKWVDLIL